MKPIFVIFALLVQPATVSVAVRKIRSGCAYTCHYAACAGSASSVKDKSDNTVVYFGLGAALTFSLLAMNSPAPAPAPTTGRSESPATLGPTLPVLLERAAGGGVQLLASFRGVLDHPACSERFVCLAEKEMDSRRDWNAALGMMGSVAAGTVLDDPVTLSDAVLPFLFRRPQISCGTLSPSCDIIAVD